MRVHEWLKWKGKKVSNQLVKHLFALGLTKAATTLRDYSFSSKEISRQISLEILFKGPAALKKCLGLDESYFAMVDGCAHRDAKQFYCYGIADEIFRVAIAALQWDQLLEGSDFVPGGNPIEKNIDRVVHERTKAEQEMWIRKLTEHLINLICLGDNQRDGVFRAVLAAQSLDDHLGLDKDFRDFYACRNENNLHSVMRYARIIEDVQRKEGAKVLPLFADSINSNKLPPAGRVLSSVRERFKLALKKATPEEKLALRLSYSAGFSESSRAIHATVQDRPAQRSTSKEIDGRLSEVGLLSAHILKRMYSICSMQPSGLSRQMINALHHPESIAPKIVGKVQQEYSQGDIVLVMGDPAEVLRCMESEYGYTSVRVKYLAKPPLPEIPEDEFPSSYVQLLVAAKDIKEFMLAQVDKMPAHLQSDVRELFSKGTPEQLLHGAREAILDMHKSGALRVFLSGNTES
jgi:hypothetical protein